MADVLFVPYGNAHWAASGDSWTFTCQHGEKECAYNQIESCSNFYISNPLEAFNFIKCVEANDGNRKATYDDTIALCSQEAYLTALETSLISQCWNSQQGLELEHANALLTDALNPPHTWVPWFVGQGVHNDDIQAQIEASLLDYVCANYTGPNRSAACDTKHAKMPVAHEYCYKTPAEFLQ